MGVDVWAEDATERVAVQAKRYQPGNTVGREVIQKLESTLARGEADKVAVVTTSEFAGTAEEYAVNSSAVELIDGEALVSQLNQSDVPAVEPDS